jgi:hypothetical protein
VRLAVEVDQITRRRGEERRGDSKWIKGHQQRRRYREMFFKSLIALPFLLQVSMLFSGVWDWVLLITKG